MSIDEQLVARILSKSRSPYIRGELNIKKYVGNKKISTLPIYGPLGLEKFRAHPLITGEGEEIRNFQVWGTPEKRHETCQNCERLT